MKKLLIALFLSFLTLSVQAAEPSAASIERLLDLMQTRRTMDAVIQRVDGMIKPMMDKAIESMPLSPQKRKEAENCMSSFSERMKPIMIEELSWDRMKELSLKLYSENFTQEEVDGLIAFYESPVGKAFVEKIPLVTQKSIMAVQERIGPMLAKIRQAAQEIAKECKGR